MPLPDQTPKLPKLPFVAGDVLLLAAAGFIANGAPHPLPIETVYAIIACVGVGTVIGVIPFLTDYARRQDEALDERQRSLEALARTTSTAAEQISIAARGLQELVELAGKNLKAPAPDRRDDAPEKERAARQAAAAEKMQAAAQEFARIGGERAKAGAQAQERLAAIAGRIEELTAALAARLAAAPVAAAAEAPGKPPGPPAAEPEAPPAEAPAAVAPPPAPPPPEAPPKPRRKPKPPPPPAAEAPPAEPALPLGEPEKPEDPPEGDALASDGSTRLLVTSYIGIGNRLFIRGDGPGLGWDRGRPLQFVSIGKWRWETSEATAPVRFKLYKNDEIECASLGETLLEPGRQREVTAQF